MNCQEFEERLNDLLDERLPVQEDPQLRAHATFCNECRESWLAQQQIVDFFHQPRPAVRAEWSRQNQERCVVSSRPSRRIFDYRWLVVAAVGVAAAVVLMFSPAWKESNVAQDRNGLPEARKSRGAFAVAQPQRPQRLFPSGKEANSLPAKNDVAPAELTLDQILTWQQWADYLPGSLEQLEQVEDMSPGLRPLRSSFSVAFHTLWRAFPGSREHRQKPTDGVQRTFGERHLS